jgi:hypothetical protein
MTRISKFLGILLVVAGPFALACGGADENLPPPPPPPPPPPASTTPPPEPPPPADTTPKPPPLPAATLLPGAPSPDPTAPTPTVKFLAPTAGQAIPADKAKDFVVKVDVKNWQTAPGSQHVHLILDNTPYKPLYDTKAPVKLSELPGGDALSEGQHVLVAFPSRANHESVKTAGALAVIEFFVGKPAKDRPVDLKKPMLIYSRPKGSYDGEKASHVLVDFYLAHDTLADDKDHVHVNVTGPGIESPLTADVTKWGTPYYLDNLQDGTFTVKLDLLSSKGDAIPGPWNSTTREITINHAATSATPAAAGSTPPAATPPPAK